MNTRQRQRGWVGLIVLLVALLIVAMLAQTALKRYGLLPDDRATATTQAGPRGVGPTTPMSVDPTGATPVPRNAIERARGLESSLQQQTQEMGQRIDAQTK